MEESDLLKSMLDNMELAYSELQGSGEAPIKTTDVFMLKDFWLKLCVATQSISKETTKLCLLLSKPPVPSLAAINDILRSIESFYNDAMTTFYSFPKEHGQVLRKEVQNAMLKLMESLMAIVRSVKDEGVKGQKDRLKLAGWVWEACETVEKLSRDNLAASCKHLKKEEMLVADALQEIDNEVKADENREEVDNSETWSNQDRELLPPCIGLVKTARSCLKRINRTVQSQGKCDSEEKITELDNLVMAVERLSPAVDEFVSSVYPPMDRTAVRSGALSVVSEIRAILQLARQSHYILKEDHAWVEFLLKAVDHNNNKLQPLLAS
ncbi:cyclin-D1-binding protein 1 homolog isoform X2 [Anabrus simplex]|uniref:cyclin-D1-binding protein 1 homolog isoform X2 n=1 Tax=Anabrus simplex TaxID=316456 RepID=UPI0035A2C375